MANFTARNALFFVPVVVLSFITLYWFKKKKKKPDDLSLNQNASLQFDSNHGDSIYSPIESTSDFSNTLSDASSISSPENSIRNENLCETPSEDTSIDTSVKDILVVKNNIDHLSFSDFTCRKNEKPVTNCTAQIYKTESVDSPSIENELGSNNIQNLTEMSKNSVQMNLPEKLSNSLHISESGVDNFLPENDETITEANCSFELRNGLLSGNITNLLIEQNDEQSSNAENNSFDNMIEEPVISKIESNFLNNMLNDHSNLSDPFKLSEADSHSSVLDENSLSSMSDESDQQADFKCKDSPSTVFYGNSISDESEKVDIGNEQVTVHLKPGENGIRENCIDNEVSSSISDEKYSVQLNKNSFFAKTILSESVSNKISWSNSDENIVNNSATSLQNSDSLILNSSHSSINCLDSKDDSSVTVEHNNQYTLLQNIDTPNLSSPKTSTDETIALTSEEVVSSTLLPTSCNRIDGQFETATSLLCCDNTISSSTDEIPISQKDPSKVDGPDQLDSISPVLNSSENVNIKAQDRLESLSQNKVSELDMADMKSPVLVPGLFVYEFDLPQELCGRLIGKQGKHVKSIKERTNANVFIKRHPFDSNIKTVVVEGSRTSVYEALDVIRRKFPPSQFPAVSLIQTNMINSYGVSLPESLQLHLPEGASCDVILSSLVSAGHFFLQQPTHPTYPSLSTLDQCMITCYNQVDTPQLPHPVEAGVICAAPVMNGWFRAQVIYMYENRNECGVKFVDYGGFQQVLTSALRQIRSDFMTLPFQASECFLANVRPVDRNVGWSSEATSVFEELAQGQILQALLVEYSEDGIPCVHLYRVQGVSNMFINRELVERGLALWVDNNHWDPH